MSTESDNETESTNLNKADRSMERRISRTLLVGIIVTATLMLVGFLLYAFQPQYWDSEIPLFSLAFVQLQFNAGIGNALLNPFLFLYSGILVLMTIPIVRVLMAGYSFLRQRDIGYTLISVLVLVVICISIIFSVTH